MPQNREFCDLPRDSFPSFSDSSIKNARGLSTLKKWIESRSMVDKEKLTCDTLVKRELAVLPFLVAFKPNKEYTKSGRLSLLSDSALIISGNAEWMSLKVSPISYFLINPEYICLTLSQGSCYVISRALSFLRFKKSANDLGYKINPLRKSEIYEHLNTIAKSVPSSFKNCILNSSSSSLKVKTKIVSKSDADTLGTKGPLVEVPKSLVEVPGPLVQPLVKPLVQPLAEPLAEHTASALDRSVKLFVYPKNKKNPIAVTYRDYKRLFKGNYINDTVVEFYVRWCLNEKYPNIINDVHVFSTFFYANMSSEKTVKVDIFSKKFLLMPINESLHWYLALIYNPKALIDERQKNTNCMQIGCLTVIFDSMDMYHARTALKIKNFLISKAREKHSVNVERKDIKFICAKIPQQTNNFDCGIYMLKYMETFLSDPDKYISLIMKGQRNDSEWFTREDIESMRGDIMDNMKSLAENFL